MKISSRESNGVSILDLKGKSTIGVGDVALREAVTQALEGGKTKIILNMNDVTLVDSSGMGELVSAYATTRRRGARLVLENLTPKGRELLHFTQLDSLFEVHDTEDEALAAFA